MTLTAALITHNEEANIGACLETVRWADEIVLVDSGSTDRTVEKARAYASRIYEIPFRDFASQKNAALDRATGQWVFFIDADERVPAELAAEIREIVRAAGPDHVYAVKRLTYFFGKPLRFSATQDDYPIRLFPREAARFEQPVHETLISSLAVKRLKSPLIHYSTRDCAHYRAKLAQYVPLELEVMEQRLHRRCWTDLLLRPTAKFCYLYFWRLGILDGFTGLVFALLSSYYSLLKYWKFNFTSFPVSAEVAVKKP